MTQIVDKVYANGYSPVAQAEFEKRLNNSDISEFAEKIIAGTHDKWAGEIFEKTDAQIEVLPKILFEEFKDLTGQKLYIQARQLFVPICWGQYHKARKMNAIRYDQMLSEHIVTLAYDNEKGLDSDKLDDSNFF